MEATLINSFPETLKYVEEVNIIDSVQNNNIIEGINSIELSNSIVLSEITDFVKIIKMLGIIFLIATFNIIFPYEDNKDSFNYKLYIIILVLLIVYIIYTNELYIIIGVFIFIAIFVIPALILLYLYLMKNETINIIFYSYNNQLKNVFSNNFNNYELIFNVFFISIIFILSIVLYWDNVYADAKKISKCGQILQIIEENTYKKNPYVYNIIIIDNDSLDVKISNYIIKITYDFIKMKTFIENVKDIAIIYYTKDDIKKFRKQILIDITNEIDDNIANDAKKTELISKINTKESYEDFISFITSDLRNLIKEVYTKEITAKFNTDYLGVNLSDEEKKIEQENIRYKMKSSLFEEYIINDRIKKFSYLTTKEAQKTEIIEIETDCRVKYIDNELLKYSNELLKYSSVKYFNLRNMDADTIENVDPIIFNNPDKPDKYKFLCVDNNNIPIYNYSSKELIKFTKNYAKDTNYNTSIIYDIIYAKINNDKVFT